MEPEKQALHWLVVGYVSDGAKEWIEACGGRVIPLHDDPKLLGVALAYNPDGKWVYSRGKQQLRQGIEFWSSGEIQEATTGITLLYQGMEERTVTEYCSVDQTYLILPDETFERKKQCALKYESGSRERCDSDDILGDLDELPF